MAQCVCVEVRLVGVGFSPAMRIPGTPVFRLCGKPLSLTEPCGQPKGAVSKLPSLWSVVAAATGNSEAAVYSYGNGQSIYCAAVGNSQRPKIRVSTSH